ncbi:hypothetical protein NQ176_g1336 [Zarea fungicola]|uniref:Uncharacterized protein n=1 Tax=Zarea fungicola TaxID=93591 RepID=A0ACC1NTX7_9HYPO|nr:hypothetical protein NQ176_g1336 [Lecanicillium fungicola]
MVFQRSVLLNTASSFLKAYNKWTVEDVLSVRSPTCIHYTLPKSTGNPPRNNNDFAAMLEQVIPVFRNFRLTVIENSHTVVDTELGKVTLHLRSMAETDVGPYENEYIFTLKISEDGKMVDEIVEFLDSQYTADIVAKLGL